MSSGPRARDAFVLIAFAALCPCAVALNPALDINQYAHTAWTVREGFSLGNIYTIAQTADGYLWLGGEFGLFRFDGVRSLPWKPPAGQQLPDRAIYRLLGARDGTLWIGTFVGLFGWSGGKLTRCLEFPQIVDSLLEDHEGTVWAGSLAAGAGTPNGRLCEIRSGRAQCYGDDGAFGRAVSALYEDSSSNLWAAARSGVWQIKPGAPRRFAESPLQLTGVSEAEDGRLVVATNGAGLLQLAGDKVEPYPIRGPMNSDRLLPDRDVNSNKLLRDRDGGLWIGTVERGLIHIHHGRTDVFTRSDGLSGDVVLSLFEDREGNVWVATTGGLDRFRELPVTTISVKQGLSSDATQSVLAAADGSIWIGAHDGVTRWTNGQATIFRNSSGPPDDVVQSLFQDDSGRIWAFTRNGLTYFKDGRFVPAPGVPGGDVHYIAGDKTGGLWLSENRSLLHVREGHLVEQIPWSKLGRRESAAVVLSDGPRGGVLLGFWRNGGVSHFKDGQVRASYTTANGLGDGPVGGLQLDRDGTIWAATQNGGLSRVKDGRITTLTSRNGLPCDTIHWSIDDDDGSFWLYTGCGLVRIARTELDAWIADPQHRVATTVWDASDGVRPRAVAATAYGPRVAKSSDGRIWFVTGEGVQVLDPRHLAVNTLPPPVRIEQVKADGKPYQLEQRMHLPANVRDVGIEFTALSLAAPEKVRFKYMLEGQDPDWREVVNERHAQYSNLRPRKYRFRLIASNNSGVWNDKGDELEFNIAPAYYQTIWFGAFCVAALLASIWGLYRYRLYQIAKEFNSRMEGRVDERLRVARDLHDTLLQSFQGLLLRFQAVQNLLPGRVSDAKRVLDTAIDDAARAITEARDAVQDMRSSTLITNELAKAVEALGAELAEQHGVADEDAPAFSVAVEGRSQDLHPILRDEIYRITGESLRNAFRHARARRIEVEIRYETRQLQVRVRDDGIGIDASLLSQEGRAGHFGLKGMRERAKGIGGQLEVWSEHGAGTEVELTIPASVAYGSRTGWRFRLFPGKAGTHS